MNFDFAEIKHFEDAENRSIKRNYYVGGVNAALRLAGTWSRCGVNILRKCSVPSVPCLENPAPTPPSLHLHFPCFPASPAPCSPAPRSPPSALPLLHPNALQPAPPFHPPPFPLYHSIHRLNCLPLRNPLFSSPALPHPSPSCPPPLLHPPGPSMQNLPSSSFKPNISSSSRFVMANSNNNNNNISLPGRSYYPHSLDIPRSGSATWVFSCFSSVLYWYTLISSPSLSPFVSGFRKDKIMKENYEDNFFLLRTDEFKTPIIDILVLHYRRISPHPPLPGYPNPLALALLFLSCSNTLHPHVADCGYLYP